MTEPCDLSAVEARRLIGARQLSAVELLDSCLARIALTNPAVNVIVAMDEKRARAAARKADAAVKRGDELGLLHGLPIAIKDLEPVEGLRSTWGSLIFKDHVPTEDAASVARVRSAGGIVFAKTNVPEFGAGGNTTNKVYGPTGNPFDPALTSSGSSGGSAAALALGQVPLATGSDYGGSLRTPAAFCGVVGIRPSAGLVPAVDRPTGLMPWGVLGPMGRTVADAQLLLQAQMDIDRRDPFASEDCAGIPEVLLAADTGTLRVAFSPDLGCAPIDKAIRRVFGEKMARLGRSVHAMEEATPDFSGVHDVMDVFRALVWFGTHADKLEKHRDLLGPNNLDNLQWHKRFSFEDVARAFVEQTKIANRFRTFFDDFDVLIAPAAAVSPFDKRQLFVEAINGEKMPHYMRWLAISYVPTMALASAVALPAGRDHKGLPFGIQLLGPRGSDARLIEIAAGIEAVLAADPETARPIPDLGRLAKAR